MAAPDTIKIKEEIVNFLRTNGPNLPIPIARQVKVDSLFVSAFLSELLSEQKIKITNLRVGGSPVYYVEGTQDKLEKYSEYLKPKEREAFQKLKENSFIEDSVEEPAIRIALRNIKDFAKAFEYQGKIIWRYYLIPMQNYTKKEEIKIEDKIIEEKEEPKTSFPSSLVSDVEKKLKENDTEIEIPKEEVKIEEKEEKAIEEKKPIPKQTTLFNNPLAVEIETKKEEKPKPAFCQKIIKLIEENNWKIIEEIECKNKEYNALIKINSDLGPIIFKLQAKDKKTVSDADLSKLVGEAQRIPLPALFMSYGEIKKKAQEFLDKYISVIKYKQIE